MLHDGHIHSTFSRDGHQSMQTLCEKAVSIGLASICFTEHLDVLQNRKNCSWFVDLPTYLSEIARLRPLFPALTIGAGLEVNDTADGRAIISQLLSGYDFDCLLLSIHEAGGIDPFFFEEYTKGQGRTVEEAFAAYAIYCLDGVKHADYDVLAHIGYVAKFAPADVAPFSYCHAPDVLDELFAVLAQNGKALEVNTSGYNRANEPIPGLDILKRFREKGGEFVSIGSDAHHSRRIGDHFEQAHSLCKQAGLRYGVRFEKRQIQPYLL